eukprot:CAMPEP_0197431994 /NCGR_PEP_ID=MMETSP1175-20131217/138_1 /TAXON_ID=1003142 /ORGANISM="Triceratium dubium, Strain CCMP147" /LENGTH=859 /DNA_ID=CAMNT_0042959977 /DNA_START=122 /DNA_END=2701 /DNA_ORIENTATION=-
MATHVEAQLWRALSAVGDLHMRYLAGGGGGGDNIMDENDPGSYHGESTDGHGAHGEDEHGFGVHITYEDLYSSIIFFTVIYVMGAVCQKFLKMPSLVGEIFAGILLGPNLANFVPNPVAFVMLGEIGLILLVLEAGIDIDLTTLKLIGPRGVIIAVVGSFLPIAFGIAIAFALGVDTKGAIAAGAAFGPTSLGIAMNILRQGKIVNTPVGQLIVSAAVIDDMIALIILSQLSALTGPASVASLVIPIVSALLFLCLGGYIAVYILPPLIDRFILAKIHEDKHGPVQMMIMLGMMLALMPATYYAQASFLMGVFVAGLTFCRSEEVHHMFVRQFKRILQWLMRIFFAASIGFQVPITQFGNGTVIWQGLVFTLALLGKLLTGLLVPNFNGTARYRDLHLRDCFATGFSMAAEGEFAFVIAIFAVDSGLISQTLYASVVLAVLLSTIFPPFALRFTITYWNKKSEQRIQQAAEMEMTRRHDIESGDLTEEEKEEMLREGILAETTFFMCVQAHCQSKWGLLTKIITALSREHLEVIDHRSWHPRGVDTTMVNEIFVQAHMGQLAEGQTNLEYIKEKMGQVEQILLDIIDQPDSRVRVNRWIPGIVEEVVEEVETTTTKRRMDKHASVSQLILNEAAQKLERDKSLQTQFTKQKSVQEILGLPETQGVNPGGAFGKSGGGAENGAGGLEGGNLASAGTAATMVRQPKRVRQKMRSTPVIGGDLFGESRSASVAGDAGGVSPDFLASLKAPGGGGGGFGGRFGAGGIGGSPAGHACDLTVGKETFKIRISTSTLNRIRSGFSGGMVDDGSISISAADVPIENRLQGFVRNQGMMASITEEEVTESDAGGSDTDHDSFRDEKMR